MIYTNFEAKLIDYVSDAIITFDMNYTIITWNKAAETLYGWKAEEVIGKNSHDLIPVEFPYDNVEDVRKKFSEKGSWKGKCIQYHKDGSRLNILSSSVIIKDDKSNSKIVVTINKDITESKKIEEKLIESEKRFRKVVENAPIGYYRVGKDGLWQYVNSEWEKMHNYSLQEIIGKSFEITQPENAKEQARIYVQRVLSGESITGEFGRTKKDGTVEYHTFNIQPIYQKGEIIAIEGFINDITKYKEIEQRLIVSESNIRKLNNELEQKIEERTKELKESEASLRKSQMDLSILNRISNIFLTFQDHEMYSEVLNIILSELRSDYGIFGYLNERGDLVEPSLSKNIWEKCEVQDKDIVFPKELWSKNIFGRVIFEKRSIRVNRPFSVPDGHIIIQKFLGTPIIDNNNVIGLLIVANKKTDYNEEDTRKLELIANKIASILNVRLQRDRFENLRKEAEQKLLESEEKFRSIFEHAGAGIAQLAPSGSYIKVNQKFCEILRYSREEMLSMTFPEITHPDDVEENTKAKNKLLKGEISSYSAEKRYIRKDGSTVWVNLTVALLRDSLKNPKYFISIIDDISEKKELEEERNKFFNLPLHLLIISGLDGVIKRVNPGWTERLGYKPKDLEGKNFMELVHPDDVAATISEMSKLSKGINTFHFENRYRHKNGTYRTLAWSASSYIEKGVVYAIAQDITERKKMEKKLKKRNVELKEMNKLKSEFLRRASHELKTPLISIKGFSDLILTLYTDQLDPVISSKIREINDGCERLQNIINNLLKTSRLESSELLPKVQKEDLSFLIKFCVHELESLAETRNQSIKLDIHDKLFANIEKEEIHDVLSNLLTNAIKYTPPNGKIEIKTELKEDTVIVSVSDSGIGFTEEQKKRIFQQFGKIERYGKGLDLGIDGTGLGLYISKRIVEAHDGKIWMESEGKSKGSTFYFALPIAK